MVTSPGPLVMSADILNSSASQCSTSQLEDIYPNLRIQRAASGGRLSPDTEIDPKPQKKQQLQQQQLQQPTRLQAQHEEELPIYASEKILVNNQNYNNQLDLSPPPPYPGTNGHVSADLGHVSSPHLQPALPLLPLEIGNEISELIIQKIKEELTKASTNMKLVVKQHRIKETEDVEVCSKDIFHSAPDTPAVTSTAEIRDNDELVRSKQLDIADRENVGDNKEMETIPQYDGGDDLKIVFCDICNQEFTGHNCVKNKKIHLLNYHFKRKIEERIKDRENGHYMCNNPSCDFKTKRKPDFRLHLASKHGLLELFLKEHLEENSPRIPGMGQASTQAEVRGQAEVRSRDPVATSPENLTQVKQ